MGFRNDAQICPRLLGGGQVEPAQQERPNILVQPGDVGKIN